MNHELSILKGVWHSAEILTGHILKSANKAVPSDVAFFVHYEALYQQSSYRFAVKHITNHRQLLCFISQQRGFIFKATSMNHFGDEIWSLACSF